MKPEHQKVFDDYFGSILGEDLDEEEEEGLLSEEEGRYFN